MPKLVHETESGPRVYRAGALSVPSVTEILKVTEGNWINSYIARVGRAEADRALGEAALLGTRVHNLAATLALNPRAPVEPDLRSFAVAIRGFLRAHVKHVLEVELSLSSARLGFGGTLDLYCMLHDGSCAVVDFKTSSGGLTRIHGLQLAGYALLLKEANYAIDKRICVRLHKSPEKQGEWYARNYANHLEDVEAFRAAKTLWWFLHGQKLKKRNSNCA